MKPITIELDNNGEPDLAPLWEEGIYIPNWFTKTHFEQLMDRNLSDDEFNEIVEYLDDFDFPDRVSGELSLFLNEWESRNNSQKGIKL